MARTSINLLCAIILCAIALSSVGCYAAQSKKLLFVFGDSLFDPGNNQYLNSSAKPASTWYPYGIDMNNKSTGRFSDGLIVPDYIAQFANLSVVPPYLQPGADLTNGANFASAAGGVLDVNNGVLNLKQQLTYFKNVAKLISKKVGAQEATKILGSSVYLFSFGGNDYFRYDSSNAAATHSERVVYMRMVVANLTNGFKEIYNMGGRKFAIQSVGPLGCLPVIKAVHTDTNGSCVENFLTHANQNNKALSNQLSKMAKELSGFKYSIMDYFFNLLYRINNPVICPFIKHPLALSLLPRYLQHLALKSFLCLLTMFLSLSTSLAANSLSFRAVSLLSSVFPLSPSTGTFSFLYLFPPLSPNSPNCHSHHHYHYRGPLCSSSYSPPFSPISLS